MAQRDPGAGVAQAVVWRRVVQEIRASCNDASQRRAEDRAVGELWWLAEAEGMRILRSFERRFGAAALRDLILDFLAARTSELVFIADDPLSYFRVAIRRRAISWNLRPGAAVAEDLEDHDAARHASERDLGADLDARRYLEGVQATLAQRNTRDREVIQARVLGGSSREIGQEHGLTANYVDVIVHNFRNDLKVVR